MTRQLRVLNASSGFKESLSAEEVAAAIAQRVHAACPTAATVLLPLGDGGAGFTTTLVTATGGSLHPVTETGPVGQPVEAAVGILGDRLVLSFPARPAQIFADMATAKVVNP